jgi:hypothetical protein
MRTLFQVVGNLIKEIHSILFKYLALEATLKLNKPIPRNSICDW